MQKRRIVGEWLFVLTGPGKSESGSVRVDVENADSKDRPLALALAEIVRLWFATRRTR